MIGFPDGSVEKNQPTNAGEAGDPGWIPESGRFPGEGNGSSILTWKIPWTDDPVDYSP